MAFNLFIGGVSVSIASSGSSSASCVSGVRHFSGRIEVDISNFTGTIILSQNVNAEANNILLQTDEGTSNKELINNNGFVGENNQDHLKESKIISTAISSECFPPAEEKLIVEDLQNQLKANGLSNVTSSENSAINACNGTSRDVKGNAEVNEKVLTKAPTLTKIKSSVIREQILREQSRKRVPNIMNSIIRKESSRNGFTTIDESERSASVVSVDAILETSQQFNGLKFQDPYPPADPIYSNEMNGAADIELAPNSGAHSFHEACSSEDINIEDLSKALRLNPEVACIRNKYGDYPAHIFANNDAVIFGQEPDNEVLDFLFELYCAYPGAFSSEGSSGQIPFAGAVAQWIDECHQLYQRDETSVYRVSELRTLSRSDKLVNTYCVRAEVQLLTQLPHKVTLTPKVTYSIKMLSLLLERLSEAAFESISDRKELFSTSWRRRNKIVRSVASLPFLIRTILLVKSKEDREALLNSTLVKSAAFCKESVGLWIVSLMAGCHRSRDCAVGYLDLISNSSINDLYGKKVKWSCEDLKRFHDSRKELYSSISRLGGITPIMLRLGDRLDEVALMRPVKYLVESTLGNAFIVYREFHELVCLLILTLTYRMIIEMLHNSPGNSYNEFFGLAFCTGIFFSLKDVGIFLGFASLDARLVKRHMSHISTMVDWLTGLSLLATLGMMYTDQNIFGRNYYGIVVGLLWWKLLLHLKGLSSSLSTLIYTILQIAGSLKYFLLVFFILIVCCSDMIQVATKTSGQCDGERDFETLCSLTPVESYVAMYGVMINGVEISAIGDLSPLTIILFIFATFSGMIVMVNILIAIVTSEYESACKKSKALFARARLEQAAKIIAFLRTAFPAGIFIWSRDNNNFMLWTQMWKLSYFILFICQETFLIRSLVTSNTLRKDGIIDHSYFIGLVVYALLHHLSIVGSVMSLNWMAIEHSESLSWLKGGKLHRFLLFSFLPVSSYLRSIGLYDSESCEDDDGEHEALKREEYIRKEEELERKIIDAIRESEQRILSFV